MATATRTEIDIDVIETALADVGYDTRYTGSDDFTSYVITAGSTAVEILDGVSGDYFRPEDVVEATIYRDGGQVEDATRKFEDAETAEEFLAAVESCFE